MDKLFLIFYKGKGNWVDKLIRFFSKSQYSHCELAFKLPDGRYHCYSSSPRDNGVREKVMNLNPENWDFIPVKINITDLVKFYNETRGMKYDFLGAIGIVVPFLHQDKKKWFCSEWCARVLGLTHPSQYSPEKLAEWIKSLK
ncbi:hypothetical protein A6A19_00865 [Actinobacillus delphinicola]|nr:hypothetical protein [Actinobacillus delphinicola]